MAKANPHKAQRALVEQIWNERHGTKKGRDGAWSAYIILRYRTTGSLAPGCDAKDFYALWDQFEMPGD